ncbi:MAG: L,D-transpeptidase [Puniceicoccales bacterium]|nr:L,D-transpeptidase [Puniceicoccales bacterium]
MKTMDHVGEMEKICDGLKISMTPQWLYVSVEEQRMYYYSRNRLERIYAISTARKGINQIRDSYGTPLGLHTIADKIGGGAPLGTVFIGRQNKGKIFTEYGDWETKGYITSRILRLKGLQEGYNLGGNCDTYSRYIYIHGITDEKKIGTPRTQGCIGMSNKDVIELFQKIEPDSLILICR